ncbi:MAG: hypothetical protein ACRDOB_15350 [Streptosporangiaceae bacterium]
MRLKPRIWFAGAAAAVLAGGLGVLVPAWGQTTTPSPRTVPATADAMAGMPMDTASDAALAKQLAAARQATAKYATDLGLAKADGYQIITKMMPDMGYHFLNMHVQGFDVRKPPILVYEHVGNGWQLGALEWVFPTMPKTPPLPDATFGLFPAACHYADGTFVPDGSQSTCAKTAPGSGAAFTFWHPDLFTMHVWVWYPNPDGLYASTNPLVTPFNAG